MHNFRLFSVQLALSTIYKKAYNERRGILKDKWNSKFRLIWIQTPDLRDFALHKFICEIMNNWEEKKIILALFIDLSKAFDSSDHSILLSELDKYGISGPAIKCMTCYSSKSTQQVKIPGVISNSL